MPDEFAVIPFALKKDNSILYALAAGLSLEVAAHLRSCGIDVAIAAPGEQDDDSAKVKLIAIAEELSTQQVLEYIEMADRDRSVHKAISGAIETIGDDIDSAGFSLQLRAVNILGGFELLSVSGELKPDLFVERFRVLMSELAEACGLDEKTKWQASSNNFSAWLMALQLNAHATLAGLNALKAEPSQVYELALKAAKLDPSQTRLREHLVDFIRNTELERPTNPMAAGTALEAVCGKTEPDWDSLFCYGILMMNGSEPARAAKIFSLLLEDKFPPKGNNKKADAAMMAGIAFNHAERFGEAQRVLGIAMKDEGNRVDAIVESAKSSAGLGELAVAERLWKRATELDPQNEDAWMNLAQAALQHGRHEEGIKMFKKVAKLVDLSREAMIAIADIFMGIDDLTAAIEISRRYVDAHQGDALAHVTLATAYNKKGQHKMALKALEKAELCHGVEEFRSFIIRQQRVAEHPKIEELFKKTAADALDGDAQHAEKALQKIVDEHTDFVEARYFLGVAMRRNDKLSEAEEIFKLLLVESDLPGCHKELTGICAILGRSSEALEHAEAALEETPGEEDPTLFTNMAAALMENDRIDDALKFAQRAEMHMPEDAFTQRIMALLKNRMGKRGLLKNLKAVLKEAWSWKRKK